MGWFSDDPPSTNPEYSRLRLVEAGAPSRWKQTRHLWLAGVGLVAGIYLGTHLGAHAQPCAPPTTTAHPSAGVSAPARP